MILYEHVRSRERGGNVFFLKRKENIIWLFHFYPDTIMSHKLLDMK